MDLYTLDKTFLKQEAIDNFNSVIWTERYIDAGEVVLVVPSTSSNVALLREGTFLGTPESKEVMILESQSIKNGLLTVNGPSLTKFLNQRVFRTSPDHSIRELNMSGMSPGEMISEIVKLMCVEGIYVDANTALVDGPKQKIPNLIIGEIDSSGNDINVLVPFGPIFDIIQDIAKTYFIGISLYLDYATTTGYSLVFKTYKGHNLTREQTANNVVQFSPNLDSLTNTQELRAISGYKNVAYAFATSNPDDLATTPGIAYADPTSELSTGFDRRVLMVLDGDITPEMVGGNPAILQAILNQRALDALANNNYVKLLDGELVPQSEFKYGTHYGLGDIIELQSMTGFWQKARVTEYIRSQDASGERAYPTISVIS